jgi:hypothetical protein
MKKKFALFTFGKLGSNFTRIRIRTKSGSVSGSAYNQCGSETLRGQNKAELCFLSLRLKLLW